MASAPSIDTRVQIDLWEKDKMFDLKMTPYGCVATGDEVGLIEIVKNANTVAGILACAGNEEKGRPEEMTLYEAATGQTRQNMPLENGYIYILHRMYHWKN